MPQKEIHPTRILLYSLSLQINQSICVFFSHTIGKKIRDAVAIIISLPDG
jgi:hypothetical protein